MVGRAWQGLVARRAPVLALLVQATVLSYPSLCRGGSPSARGPATVVRTEVLQTRRPPRQLRMTGSVEPWRAIELGFSVAGRLEWARDTADDVAGPRYDAQRTVVQKGDPVARLDPRRYDMRLKAARARLAASTAETASLRLEINDVLDETLRAKVAEEERARKEHDRQRQLLARKATTAQAVEQAKAALVVATAAVAQTKAETRARRVRLQALEAQSEQLAEEVKRAELDLADCVLRAPFDATVASLHAARGAQVAPGTPVASLVMMDPLQVKVAVAPDTDRLVQEGDRCKVVPPGRKEPVTGFVLYKDTVADRATRTFNLYVMVRNAKVVSATLSPALRSLPQVGYLWWVAREAPDSDVLGCEVDVFCRDAEGVFVWKAEPDGEPGGTIPVYRLRKVRVVPGDRCKDMVGLYFFRAFRDRGSLRHLDRLAAGVPEGVGDGDRVVWLPRQWLFRPGDLATVVLEKGTLEQGFYVPISSIQSEDGRPFVFLAQREKAGVLRARRVFVQLSRRPGSLQRVVGQGLRDGARLITDGLYGLVDGARVTEARERTPGK